MNKRTSMIRKFALVTALIALLVPGVTYAQQTVNTELPAASALSDSAANPTAPAVGAFIQAWDGTSVWKRVTFGQATMANSLPVVLSSNQSAIPVTQSGTWTMQPGNTANTTPWLMSIFQGGNTMAVNASGQASVTCANCSGSGVSLNDNTTFTAGSNATTPASGFYHATRDTVTDGRAAALAITSKRALYTTPETPAGDSMANEAADAIRVTPYAADGSSATDNTADAVRVLSVDSTGSPIAPETLGTHDATLGTMTSVTGGVPMVRASAAAPTDVSADGDAVVPWALRSGASVVNPSYGGNLAATGVGSAGTATPRVVDVASGTTGSAPPAQASYVGGLQSGATGGLLGGLTVCDDQAFLDMTTATTTELVALTSGRKIYVCYWQISANGATTVTFKRGTGTNCNTGTTTISNAVELTAQTGWTGGSGAGVIFDSRNAGDALCVTNSAGVNLHVFVRFAKY